MAGETIVTTPRPTKKMKWQQEIDEKKVRYVFSTPSDAFCIIRYNPIFPSYRHFK
jgi:hypothetical protein